MKKTIDINLSGLIFHIDEDAYYKLEAYLSALKRQFDRQTGGAEIIEDIESRIAELFRQRNDAGLEVIHLAVVEEVIATLGTPQDFAEQNEQEPTPGSPEAVAGYRRIFRDADHRVIGGVCAGLGAYFKIDPLWLRIIFLILFFAGPGLLIYLILWIALPKATTTAEKLMMQGEAVTIDSIERSIRSGAYQAGERLQRYGKQGRQGAGSFFSALGQIVARLFRLAVKLLGLLFLVIGLLFLVGLLLGVFGLLFGTVEGLPEGLTYGHLQQIFAFDSSTLDLLMAGLLLTILSPLFLLVYWGLRILFQLNALPNQVKGGLVLTTFIGLVLVLYAATYIASRFDDDAETTRREYLSIEEEALVILAQTDSISERLHGPDEGAGFLYQNDVLYYDQVSLDIQPATDSVTYLEIATEARGASRAEARRYAAQHAYRPAITGDTLRFTPYLRLPAPEPFRAQKVDLTLFLASGQSIYLHPSAEAIIHDIANRQNRWDYEMLGHHWMMTPEGLDCLDCREAPGQSL